jgi:hypothetical protein
MKDLHFARAPNGRVPLVLRGRAAGLATAATPFAGQARSINQPPDEFTAREAARSRLCLSIPQRSGGIRFSKFLSSLFCPISNKTGRIFMPFLCLQFAKLKRDTESKPFRSNNLSSPLD